VKFRGCIVLEFNKVIPNELQNKVNEIVEYLNSNVLVKGVKVREEAGKIIEFKVRDNKIVFYTEAGRQVRIHNAALRIKNYFLSNISPKYRLGIRGLRIENGIIELDGQYTVSLKLPFIKSIEVKEGRTIILLEDISESEIKKPYIDRLLKLLHEKELRTKWGGKAEHWELLRQSKIKFKEPKFTEDPNKILEEIGWIKRFSVGQWFYTPPFTYLLNMLKYFFIEEVVKPLGFQEAMFPKMYPLEVGLKTGHLKGTINSMIFASFPRSYDISIYEELIDYMYVTDTAPPEELQKYVKPPTHFLCFAQCEPFYQFFSKEVLDDKNLPIKMYDHSGPSFRWEAGGLHGVERVIEFHRVEVVWLGKPEQVVEIRNQLLERYEYFMDKVLDLEWRWAWVTPWYYEQAGIVEEEKRELDINQPGTIDFEAWLPYRGPREDKKNWLEIGNISIHGTKFTEPFKIKHNKGETLWTGCSGFGTERWTITFLAQHGFNPENWPEKPRKYIEENPFPIPVRGVTYPKTEKGRKLLEEIIRYFKK